MLKDANTCHVATATKVDDVVLVMYIFPSALIEKTVFQYLTCTTNKV